jgi:uncharacterized protein
LDSDARRRTLDIRATRARTCEAYSYDACCSRIPIVEALPSERAYDAANSLQCLVARPMIEFLIDQIRRDKAAIATIRQRSNLGTPGQGGRQPPATPIDCLSMKKSSH